MIPWLTGAVDKGIVTVPAIDQTRCIIGGFKATRKRFYWLIPIDRSDHAFFRKSPCTREGPRAAHSGSRRQHSAAINSSWAASVQPKGTRHHGHHQGVVSVSTVLFFLTFENHCMTSQRTQLGKAVSSLAGHSWKLFLLCGVCVRHTRDGWDCSGTSLAYQLWQRCGTVTAAVVIPVCSHTEVSF